MPYRRLSGSGGFTYTFSFDAFVTIAHVSRRTQTHTPWHTTHKHKSVSLPGMLTYADICWRTHTQVGQGAQRVLQSCLGKPYRNASASCLMPYVGALCLVRTIRKGTQVTYFTITKVQILTQKAVQHSNYFYVCPASYSLDTHAEACVS